MGVRLHKWPPPASGPPSDGGADLGHVKVPTLAFDIVEGTELVGKTIKDLGLVVKYGMHVVKVLQQQPHGWIDYPSIRTSFAVGDRLFVVFETPAGEELLPAASNGDLRDRFADFFVVGKPGCPTTPSKSKKAALADESRWTPKFRLCVEDCGLRSEVARLTCESFSCFELPYPADAPPGLIGSCESSWRGSAFPKVPEALRPRLRALSMRYNFNLSPVMVYRPPGAGAAGAGAGAAGTAGATTGAAAGAAGSAAGAGAGGAGRRYRLPALGRTVVEGGDVLLCLVEGGPGANKFALDQRIWRSRLEEFFSAQALERLDLACDVAAPPPPVVVARSDASRRPWAELVDSDDDPQKTCASASSRGEPAR